MALQIETFTTDQLWIYRIIETVCKKLPELTEIKHLIHVTLCPTPYLWTDNNGAFIQACFIETLGKVFINLAVDIESYAYVEAMSDTEAIDNLIESLVHEVCHYEQYRDNKCISERGVEKRTRVLMEQLT